MSRGMHIRGAGPTGHSEREVNRRVGSFAGEAHLIRGEPGLRGRACACRFPGLVERGSGPGRRSLQTAEIPGSHPGTCCKAETCFDFRFLFKGLRDNQRLSA